MLSDTEIQKLDQRARNAVNGYAADINITCYVYGQDILALLRDREELRKELRNLTPKVITEA